MIISGKMVADKLLSYLNHDISKETLIDWCERLVNDEIFENEIAQEVVARIGLMDAKNFEVSYEDLTEMLGRLGYRLKVEVV